MQMRSSFFFLWAFAYYTHPILSALESSKYLSAEHFDGRRAKGYTANLKNCELSSWVVEADKPNHQFFSFPPATLFPTVNTTRVRIYLLSKKRETWKLFALETAPPLIILGRFVSLSLAFSQEVYLQYTNHPILTYGGSFYFSGHHSLSTSLNRLLIPNS